MTDVTYTEARATFASLWDRLVGEREVVVVHRRGPEPIAMIAAGELAGLLETAHLMRSPRNAERLLAALDESRAGDTTPLDAAALRAHLGLAAS